MRSADSRAAVSCARRRRCSSAARRSERSRVTLAKPTSAPSPSRSAVMTTLAQKRVPSLRMRHPSSSKRPSRAASFELARRLARPHVVVGVEPREVRADDLARAIALDALGAAVPRRYMSLRVKHENGVVTDALHEQAKAELSGCEESCGALGEASRIVRGGHDAIMQAGPVITPARPSLRLSALLLFAADSAREAEEPEAQRARADGEDGPRKDGRRRNLRR